MSLRRAQLSLAVATLLLMVEPSRRCVAQTGGIDSGALKRQFAAALSDYHAKKYDAAQKQLETLLREFPSDFEVHELLGLVYTAQGKCSKAVAPLEAAVRFKPDSAIARVNLAMALLQCGKKSLALGEFRKAVEIAPEDFEANHQLGTFYVRSGAAKEAIPHLEKAQRIRSDSYSNGYELALAYFNAQQPASARREIQNLLARRPTAEAYSLLGEVEDKSGDYAEAAKAFQQAAGLDPAEENLFAWGNELLVHGQAIPATEAFQRGAQQYPRSARLWVGLGIALYARSDYPGAVRALLRASDISPEDPRPYFFLANAYTLGPNISDAEGSQVTERLRRLREASPRNPQALFYYALCLWKQQRGRGKGEGEREGLGQVEFLLKESARLDASFPAVHLELGMLYQTEQRNAEAIQELQQAVKLDPNLSMAHYRLAQLYKQAHEEALAEQELQAFGKLRSPTAPESNQQGRELDRFLSAVKAAANQP